MHKKIRQTNLNNKHSSFGFYSNLEDVAYKEVIAKNWIDFNHYKGKNQSEQIRRLAAAVGNVSTTELCPILHANYSLFKVQQSIA